MDYRLVRSGMRVQLKNGVHDKIGTIRYVYNQDGFKLFDIIFDGEDRMSCAWSIRDRKVLHFKQEEFKMDFDDMLKSERKK